MSTTTCWTVYGTVCVVLVMSDGAGVVSERSRAVLEAAEPRRDKDSPTVFYQVLPPHGASSAFSDATVGVLGGLPTVPIPGRYGKGTSHCQHAE